MKAEEVFSTLSSKTRLEILKVLASRSGDLMEIKRALDASGLGIKYRESVYRALDRLASAGLVEKFYDRNEKKIKYALAVREIRVRFGPSGVELKIGRPRASRG